MKLETAWILGSILPIILAIVQSCVYIVLLKKNHRGELLALGVISILLTFFSTLAIAYTLWSGLGPGVPAGLSSGTVGFGIALLIVLSGMTRSAGPEKQDHPIPAVTSRLGIIAGLIIIASLVLPPMGAYAYLGACDALHRQIGKPLTKALDEYNQNTGNYPEEIKDLVPGYLPQIPTPVCLIPYRWIFRSNGKPTYDLKTCQGGRFLYVTATVLGASQRYNPSTGEWAMIDGLDDTCP